MTPDPRTPTVDPDGPARAAALVWARLVDAFGAVADPGPALTPLDRVVLTLVDGAGVSYTGIADLLCTTPPVVAAAHHDARERAGLAPLHAGGCPDWRPADAALPVGDPRVVTVLRQHAERCGHCAADAG